MGTSQEALLSVCVNEKPVANLSLPSPILVKRTSANTGGTISFAPNG